jgi:hypothetical protein
MGLKPGALSALWVKLIQRAAPYRRIALEAAPDAAAAGHIASRVVAVQVDPFESKL